MIRGATVLKRRHPFAGLIQQLYRWSDEQRDEFWLAASSL